MLIYVYSELDIVFVNSSSGSTRHFYANGLHIADNRFGTVEYYHQNRLGSIRIKMESYPKKDPTKI